MREIEEGAAWAPRLAEAGPMAGKDGGKDVTRGSANVGDVRVGGKIVGCGDGGCVRTVDADKEVAEHGGLASSWAVLRLPARWSARHSWAAARTRNVTV
jgi:hypothetical protein